MYHYCYKLIFMYLRIYVSATYELDNKMRAGKNKKKKKRTGGI